MWLSGRGLVSMGEPLALSKKKGGEREIGGKERTKGDLGVRRKGRERERERWREGEKREGERGRREGEMEAIF